MIISVEKAEYLEDYKIKFRFSDGTQNIIDFYSFLQNAKNPMTRKYLDMNLFKNFSVQFGDIQWNDYDLCFPVWDLHNGKI